MSEYGYTPYRRGPETREGNVMNRITRAFKKKPIFMPYIPLVLMGYYNPMLAYGLEKFICDAVDAGADGFIVPDLPVEESDEFTSALTSYAKGSGATQSGSAVEAPLIQMLAP